MTTYPLTSQTWNPDNDRTRLDLTQLPVFVQNLYFSVSGQNIRENIFTKLIMPPKYFEFPTRIGLGSIPKGMKIIIYSDGTLAELYPLFKNIMTLEYAGYIRAEAMSSTKSLCTQALADIRDCPAIFRIYIVTNSDHLLGARRDGDDPTLERLYWRDSFSPFREAAVTPSEMQKIRYIVPWKPHTQTSGEYQAMLIHISNELESLGFPASCIINWTTHKDANDFNENRPLQPVVGTTGPPLSNFGGCWKPLPDMLPPWDCHEHQMHFPLHNFHLTELGFLEFWDIILATEPDKLLRWFDIHPTKNFRRLEFNHTARPHHFVSFWTMHPTCEPGFTFQYGTVAQPRRRNFTGEHSL